MDHLALAVSDQDCSKRFYETYLGFEAEAEPRADGVLLLHNAQGFSLALGETEEPIQLPSFLHFGAGLASRRGRSRVPRPGPAGGVEVVDWWDEPDYVSVKFRDPDGYVVEVSRGVPSSSA